MGTIKNIRTNVFRVSQGEFAKIVGVNQSTVSKWESESRAPDLDQLKRIREEAFARNLEWSDELFFGDSSEGEKQEHLSCLA